MAFLDNIVTAINDKVKESLSAFPTAAYYGLAYQLPKKEGDKVQYIPALIDLRGEAKWLTFDDLRAMNIYHRIVSSAYTQLKQDAYGDGNDYFQQSYDMDMVVMASRKKVQIQPDALEMAIASNMPTKHKIDGFEYINIASVSANYNARTVFQQEFQNIDYFLKPEHILLSIRYRVELRYRKGCISLCQCNRTVKK
jgi:hypothetical protein